MIEHAPEMAAFVRVVDLHGFSAAAPTLGLSPSAVSKLVTRLETRLGVRLLQRTTRALHLTAEGEVRTVDRDYFRFDYDYSILHDRADVVLTVTFRLNQEPEPRLREVIRENLRWRDERHPDLWLYPSAGSIFKKKEGVGAGRLVDQCGLKGRRIGDAQISHMHANIMINLGHATAKDVRELIALAQSTVEKNCGVHLEPEIGFIGEF